VLCVVVDAVLFWGNERIVEENVPGRGLCWEHAGLSRETFPSTIALCFLILDAEGDSMAWSKYGTPFNHQP